MKRILMNTALVAGGCMLAFTACKKEASNPVTREITVSAFDKVTAGDDHEVQITAGNNYSMQARGDIADVNELRAVIESRILKIDYPVYRSGRKRVHINITMPKIKMLDFGGASYGNVSGFNTADTMKVSLSGDSRFTVNANIALFDVNVTGTSALNINGSSDKLVLDASGQGKYNGYGLNNTRIAFVWTSGQANANVYCRNQLFADASGQSKVFYTGNPARKSLTTSGQATITAQ